MKEKSVYADHPLRTARYQALGIQEPAGISANCFPVSALRKASGAWESLQRYLSETDLIPRRDVGLTIVILLQKE